MSLPLVFYIAQAIVLLHTFVLANLLTAGPVFITFQLVYSKSVRQLLSETNIIDRNNSQLTDSPTAPESTPKTIKYLIRPIIDNFQLS